MLSGGIPPTPHSAPHSAQSQSLQPGQTYSGVVRVHQGALVAQLAGAQLPLPEGAGLAPGQRIAVHILASGSAVQFEVAPAPASAAPPQSGESALTALLRPLLQALGKLDQAPRAASLLPPQFPATGGSLQPLLTVLLADRGLGQDLQQLQQLLAGATARGGLAPDTISAIAQWIGLTPGATAETWQGLLERARAERAAAARIAQSLGPRGNAAGLAGLRDSAAALVQRLLNDAGFLNTLRERGELDPFRALAGRIQEHARGADLQNLRSLDQPYQFLELPVREDTGFRRAHVHSFSDARSGSRSGRDTVYQTVLDLDMTWLGPLWIGLRAVGSQCACRVRTTSPEVIALFEAEAPSLRDSLAKAGFPDATITAELWDGNRGDTLIELFAPFQKLDLEG